VRTGSTSPQVSARRQEHRSLLKEGNAILAQSNTARGPAEIRREFQAKPSEWLGAAAIFIAFRGAQAQANQLRKSSSAASQPRKINEINHLHDRMRAELLSTVPSVVCVGQAALDDVRNWLSSSTPLMRLPARRTFRSGHGRTNEPVAQHITIVRRVSREVPAIVRRLGSHAGSS
jgi:hypothetical protein